MPGMMVNLGTPSCVSGAKWGSLAKEISMSQSWRSGVERAWHEWEVELGPAAPADADARAAFFAAVEEAALAAGARPAASDSKLARALGH